MYDELKRERQDVEYYFSNKIKRCRQCGNELNYKEKFYNTDKICNACRSELERENKEDRDKTHRTSFAQKMYEMNPERQLMIEAAEQKYFDEQRKIKEEDRN